MKIDLNTDRWNADGFTEEEIVSIRHYLETAPSIDNTATVVQLRVEMMLVCRTVGLAIKAVRPEAYLGTVEEANTSRRRA